MNNVMHQQLNQLRVISLINEGDKAKLEDGFLTVDPMATRGIGRLWRQWWIRPWANSTPCKEETVRYLQQFYISISETIDQITSEFGKSEDKKYDKLLLALVNLTENLYYSINGIENLAKTYREHPKQCSEIKGIINDYARPALQILLSTLPEDKVPRAITKQHIETEQTLFE
jgi:hypothetical protein